MTEFTHSTGALPRTYRAASTVTWTPGPWGWSHAARYIQDNSHAPTETAVRRVFVIMS